MDNHKESIVAFHHADAAWTTKVDSVMDPTRDVGYYGDADLAEYLGRPVRLLDADWTVTAGSYQTALDPWTLFLNDANVKKRVEGYRLLQGTLNIRIMLNGGPFYYGKAIASYFPRQPFNAHSFGAVTGEYYKQQLSMLPHVFLDATTSQGGEIVCPFLCPDNWIDLPGETYEDMGRLHICSINDLLHANSSTGKVNIAVFAWMTNVRLAAPTSRPFGDYEAHSGTEVFAASAAGVSIIGAIIAWMNHFKCSYVGSDRHSDHDEVLEPQAGDEYGQGIISKPASAVAHVAGMLANIPSIKPFARPTEMVASSVGRVAHFFGYSRPTIVSQLERAKIKGAGNMAATDAHEAVAKLSLDSKQELTIDPRTVGLSDVDEMAFNYIKQKEAYVSTIAWSESDQVDASLGVLSVGPDFHNEETINTYPLSLPVPMYTLALPFRMWKGTIKFRFQIVASQMHRGRLRFCYDPVDFGGASPDENEVYSRVIDLATNRDFTMEVSWNQAKSWLLVLNRLNSSQFSHPVGTQTISRFHHNGQLRIEVANELTSPNPSLAQDVYINVFVSAGEDFELANPTDDVLRRCEYEPQSGYEPHSGTDGEEVIDNADDIPESPAPVTPIGTEESLTSPHNHVFMGESFASVRALLKRYCYHMSYVALLTARHAYIVESNFPTEPGQSRYPRHLTSAAATPASTAYTYSNMTLLNWFTPCYVGWRGALRSKYVLDENEGMISVRRISSTVPQNACGITALQPNKVNASGGAAELLGLYRSIAGCDVTPTHTDGAAEVEFPFYSYRRFAHGREFTDGTGGTDYAWAGVNQGHVVNVSHGQTEAPFYVHRYVAAGDDFSLFMWIGSPGVYFREKPNGAGSSVTTPAYQLPGTPVYGTMCRDGDNQFEHRSYLDVLLTDVNGCPRQPLDDVGFYQV